MKKIVIHSAGSYDKLKIESFPDLSANSGEVVVDIYATGINYADCAVRWGVYESAKTYVGWPITPGFEFSGVVKSVGINVQSFKVGDKVLGLSRFGAYATQIAVPEHQVFKKPEHFTFEQAAGFPAVHMTAYHALFQNFAFRKKMKFLVHSAAGGVGTAILQIGHLMNCRMVGVVGSTHKIDAAKKFGADIVIDKSTENLWEKAQLASPEGYDAIFDANGPETLQDSYNHLAPCGKLVVYGFHTMLPQQGGRLNYVKLALGWLKIPRFDPMKLCTENKSVIGFNISFLLDRKDLLDEGMGQLLRWVHDRNIVAPLVTVFPFEQVAEAHKAIESGKSVGKLVLSTHVHSSQT